ncbi:MAG: SH3 domain-containing protein [Leptolyngbyaceae bacterium]|nr:SH3 domain-containing protein [Leptolyngbyaceae bacterium]
MRILLGLLKVLTGIALAIAILFLSGMYTVRYAMTRLTSPPERPVFPEETATAGTVATETVEENATGEPETPGIDESNETSDPNAGANADTDAEASPESSPEEGETAPNDEANTEEETLEPGAYQARVVQPIGLILRQGPDTSTIQLGSVAYNEELVVLSESSDGNWVKVRLPDSDVEGWVKNGNTEPLVE